MWYRSGILTYYLGSIVRLIIDFRHILLILFSGAAVVISIISLQKSDKALKITRKVDVRLTTELDMNYPVRFIREEYSTGTPNALILRIRLSIKNLSNHGITIDQIKYLCNGRVYLKPKILEPDIEKQLYIPLSLSTKRKRSFLLLLNYYVKKDTPLFKTLRSIFKPQDKSIRTLDLITTLRKSSFYLTGEIRSDGTFDSTKNPINLFVHVKEDDRLFERRVIFY